MQYTNASGVGADAEGLAPGVASSRSTGGGACTCISFRTGAATLLQKKILCILVGSISSADRCRDIRNQISADRCRDIRYQISADRCRDFRYQKSDISRLMQDRAALHLQLALLHNVNMEADLRAMCRARVTMLRQVVRGTYWRRMTQSVPLEYFSFRVVDGVNRQSGNRIPSACRGVTGVEAGKSKKQRLLKPWIFS